jgi:hypothetical protein
MNRTPIELLVLICELLPRSSLRHLRSTSRDLKAAAEPILFREIFLKFNLRSFEQIKSIASSEILRKHVKSIEYDPRMFERSSGRDYKSWYEDVAGTGLHIYQVKKFVPSSRGSASRSSMDSTPHISDT